MRQITRRALALLPLAGFGGLAAVFLSRLGAGDPGRLPSALLGRPVPKFALPGLAGVSQGLSDADLRKGRPVLLNVFASWCGPCHEEHPFLMKLAQDSRLELVGINYKDQPENARRFLGARGNPFTRVGVDTDGRTAIDWGVYGVPESFLVGGDGRILLRLVGPVSAETIARQLEPALAKATGTSS